jgi:DNA-binding NarL/FixJ family response regulator
MADQVGWLSTMAAPRPRGRRSSSGRARLLVVDDQPAARAGLRAILHTRSEFEIVAEARDADEAIKHVRQLRPDLALVDVLIPGIEGVSLTQSLKAESGSPRVLITALDPSPTRLLAGLRAGADGCVLKGSSQALLVRAIREALDGGPTLAPDLAAYLEETLRSGSNGVFAGPLSAEEAEVLRLSALGCTRSQIARALGLDPRAISVHVCKVLEKVVQAPYPGPTPRPTSV